MRCANLLLAITLALLPCHEVSGAFTRQEQRLTDSIFALEQMAQQGFALAQWQLSARYAYGLEVEPNYEKAIYWCEQAAIQGCIEAQVFLAQLLAKSNSVAAQKTAFYWLQRAAEANDAEGQYLLAQAYLYGYGVDVDGTAAELWATKSHEQGYEKAQALLEAITAYKAQQ